MKFVKFTLVILVSLAVIYFVFQAFRGQVKREPKPNPAASPPASSNQPTQWQTQTDEQPPVLVKVTPLVLAENADVWKFDITFDTHSVELDQDVMKVATLLDDKGQVYEPIGWEGPGPGGHHREGVLLFKPVSPRPEFIELKVKDVGGVKERVFKWSLK